jgi:hypothetical protein
MGTGVRLTDLTWELDPEPLGELVDGGTFGVDDEPVRVLQRCNRSLRLANLRFVSSSARTSSTHSRSYDSNEKCCNHIY